MNALRSINPEFQRQLWLQFSVSRLVVAPVLLSLIMLGIYWMSEGDLSAYSSIAMTGGMLFIFFTIVMGANAAGNSMVEEINEHTWDQQRMNAMTPWSMVWGKLFGSTAFAWYCGAWCLVFAVPAALANPTHAAVWRFTAIAILVSLLVQTVVLTVQLQMAHFKRAIAKRGNLPIVFAAILWIAIPIITNSTQDIHQEWWGYTFERVNFSLLSLVLFTVCAMVMVWRSMAEALLVRQWPWGWPVLALLINTYISGFASEQRGIVWCVSALLVSVVFTYLSLLSDKPSVPHWKRIVTRFEGGQWKIAIQSLPRWVSTLLLAFPLALLVTGLPNLEYLDLFPPSLQGDAAGVWLHAMVVWLILLRDAALGLAIGFMAERHRRTISFIVVMMVLHGLLPWLVWLGREPLLNVLAAPLFTPAPFTVVSALVHAGLALGFLLRRWRTAAA